MAGRAVGGSSGGAVGTPARAAPGERRRSGLPPSPVASGAYTTSSTARRPFLPLSSNPSASGPAPASDDAEAATQSRAKRPRKERGPNWQAAEVNILILAKRKQFLDELDRFDSRGNMIPDAHKWALISDSVMQGGISPCSRDGPACKAKWNQVVPEYKKISDYFSQTGTNEPDYWTMTTAQRKAKSLPRTFPRDVFYTINDWYGSRPSVLPPHARDLQLGGDKTYRPPGTTSHEAAEDASIDDDVEEAFAVEASVEESDAPTEGTLSPPGGEGNRKVRALIGLPVTSPSASGQQVRKGALPPRVTAQVLSSSDTTNSSAKRRSGSTGVRRKNVTGHSLIAEATQKTGDAMAAEIRELAVTSRQLEQSRIDVHRDLFSQQMEYRREQGVRLHDSARTANENARLSIEKQSELVTCLSSLCAVLSTGLRPRAQVPQAADPPQNTVDGEHGSGSNAAPMPRSQAGGAPSSTRAAYE